MYTVRCNISFLQMQKPAARNLKKQKQQHVKYAVQWPVSGWISCYWQVYYYKHSSCFIYCNCILTECSMLSNVHSLHRNNENKMHITFKFSATNQNSDIFIELIIYLAINIPHSKYVWFKSYISSAFSFCFQRSGE